MKSITQERLFELLDYNEFSGFFTWKVARPKIHIGMKAGSVSKEGYVRITIDRVRYMGHTLAWLFKTGEYIPRGIDHRNTVRSHNAWSNLRKASPSQQMMNANRRSDNASGFKGVYLKNGSSRFAAQIKKIHLGYFNTPKEAAAAYAIAANAEFGEFARVA